MVFGVGRAADGAALSGQLAALASAQLPLGPGLRALAAEVPGRSLRKALVQLANRLEAGLSPAEALDATLALPAHFRGAMEAGLKTGRLGGVLTEFAALERQRLDLNRRIWASLRYPCILFFTGLAVFLVYLFLIAPGFARVLTQFGIQPSAVTTVAIWTAQHGLGGMVATAALGIVGVIVLRAATRRGWAAAFWNWLPLLGPLWRFQDLSEFSYWMALLVGQELPLPEALRLAAGGLHAQYVGEAARRAARRIEEGAALADALREEKTFAPTLVALVGPAATGSLAEGFRTAAAMFTQRADAQAQRLRWLALPVTSLVVLALVGFMLMGLFVPLIQLIQMLS